MTRWFRSAVSATVLLAFSSQALAQATPPPAAPPPPEKPGSVYVQCDGQPAGLSGAELAGLLFMITATGGVVGGLVGAPETADDGKKAKADDAAPAETEVAP